MVATYQSDRWERVIIEGCERKSGTQQKNSRWPLMMKVTMN